MKIHPHISVYIGITIALSCLFLSCKKDKLSAANIHQIATHTNLRLNKIQVVNDSVILIVGGDRFKTSEIFRSHDGGYDWQWDTYPEAGKGLYAIARQPNGAFTALGFDGKWLQTNDQGLSWHFKQLAFWYPMKDLVFFPNGKCLMIAGVSWYNGHVLHADTNGQIDKIDSFGFELNDLLLLPNQVFMAANGIVLRSTDSGHSWGFLAPKDDNFSALCQMNNQVLWACGRNGSIWRSSDGGNTWTRLKSPDLMGKHAFRLNDILFTSLYVGYVVGDDGLIARSTDGGKNWSVYETPTKATLRQIELCPNGDLLIVGDGSTILRLKP